MVQTEKSQTRIAAAELLSQAATTYLVHFV